MDTLFLRLINGNRILCRLPKWDSITVLNKLTSLICGFTKRRFLELGLKREHKPRVQSKIFLLIDTNVGIYLIRKSWFSLNSYLLNES